MNEFGRSLDRLILSIEALNEAVNTKRLIALKQCETLRDIFKPWLEELNSETADQQKTLVTNEIVAKETIEKDEVRENLTLIDDVLKEVRKVRQSVLDKEAKKVCTYTFNEPDILPDTKEKKSKPILSNDKADIKKTRRTASTKDVKRLPSILKTTYQSSYKSSASNPTKSRSEKQPIKLTSDSNNSNNHSSSNTQPALETRAFKNTTEDHQVKTERRLADIESSILNNGYKLTIPKKMQALIKHHNVLEAKIQSVTFKSVLTEKLAKYYHMSEG